MADRFIILERLGNGYTVKDTSHRGDSLVQRVAVKFSDVDSGFAYNIGDYVEPVTNYGTGRWYVWDDQLAADWYYFQYASPLTQVKLRNWHIAEFDFRGATDLEYLNVIDNDILTLDLSMLTNLRYITAYSNNDLETVNISGASLLYHVSFLDCNLSQDAVDHVLGVLVAGGITNETYYNDPYVNVSGNTAPSTLGIGYAATLNDRGWNVNTD